jgi:protein-L-isoaspartate(D-aspartate) O-methyltransferase
MSKFVDSFRHKGLRKQLIQEVKNKGITDDAVLEAMDKLPRHYFMDSSFVEFAYQDKAFPIGAGQTISQPYTVAFQTQLMNVKKGDKILEIGTGSGYQAAILHLMGAKVFSIERQKELYVKTKAFLEQLNYRMKLFFGDGYKGLPTYAPFDKIIVTCGAPFVPEALVEQLKPGGFLIIPVGDDVQTMIRVVKNLDGTVINEEHGAFRFVPMLEDKNDGKKVKRP